MTKKEKLKLAELYNKIDSKQATTDQIAKITKNDTLRSLQLCFLKQGIVECLATLDIQEEIAELSATLK